MEKLSPIELSRQKLNSCYKIQIIISKLFGRASEFCSNTAISLPARTEISACVNSISETEIAHIPRNICFLSSEVAYMRNDSSIKITPTSSMRDIEFFYKKIINAYTSNIEKLNELELKLSKYSAVIAAVFLFFSIKNGAEWLTQRQDSV